VKPLLESKIDGTYSGLKKGWAPNYNNTFYQVKPKDFKEFEDNILLPVLIRNWSTFYRLTQFLMKK